MALLTTVISFLVLLRLTTTYAQDGGLSEIISYQSMRFSETVHGSILEGTTAHRSVINSEVCMST